MTAPLAIDWFRLLWDLIQRGHSIASISERSKISRSTLRGYLEGSHPPHWKGEKLITFWCEQTGQTRSILTRIEVVPGNRSLIIKDLVVANDETLRTLQQLAFGWAAPSASAEIERETEHEQEQPAGRYRVGLGTVSERPRAFVVHTPEEEFRANRAPNFIKWAGGWEVLEV